MSDKWDRAWPTLMQWDSVRPSVQNGALFTREMIAKAMERYGAPDRVVISTAPRNGKTAAYRAMREMMERGSVALPPVTVVRGEWRNDADDTLSQLLQEQRARGFAMVPRLADELMRFPAQRSDDMVDALDFARMAMSAAAETPAEREARIRRQALQRAGRTLVSWLISSVRRART